MNTVPAADPAVLTVDEAAQLLRISRGLAFTAVRNGTLPSIRIGRRILVPRHALYTLISGTTPAEVAPGKEGGAHTTDE